MRREALTRRVRGYAVLTHDGADVVGEVDGLAGSGVRLAAVPGHRGHRVLPAAAVGAIDDRTGTVRLAAAPGRPAAA